jgi:nitroreductase
LKGPLVTLLTDAFARTAQTSTPLHDVLAERWSPRAFDPDARIDERALLAALEAARWSPSAANTQPWRFIVARRGSRAFANIVANLKGFNSVWAKRAGALVVGVAEMVDADDNPRRWAAYDLGQAMAHLSVQAHHDGLHVHQMGGFDVAGLREAFRIPKRFEPLSIAAIGELGSADALPEPLRERELAPRTRVPLDQLLLADD